MPGPPARCFVADAVDGGDVTAVRDRVAALDCFPRRMLRGAVLLLFGRMPADRRRIEQELRAAQRRQPRGLGIPLIPANADADVPLLRRPRFEPEIAGREVKLLVKRRVIRDVHLAILPEVFAVRVDDGGGVVVNARGSLFEQRRDDHDAELAGNSPRRSVVGPGISSASAKFA